MGLFTDGFKLLKKASEGSCEVAFVHLIGQKLHVIRFRVDTKVGNRYGKTKYTIVKVRVK